MTPAARQAARVAAGREKSHLATSVVFTLRPGYTHAGGSVEYGRGWLHDLSESIVDGGVSTKDRTLVAALRGLGLYTES